MAKRMEGAGEDVDGMDEMVMRHWRKSALQSKGRSRD